MRCHWRNEVNFNNFELPPNEGCDGERRTEPKQLCTVFGAEPTLRMNIYETPKTRIFHSEIPRQEININNLLSRKFLHEHQALRANKESCEVMWV